MGGETKPGKMNSFTCQGEEERARSLFLHMSLIGLIHLFSILERQRLRIER